MSSFEVVGDGLIALNPQRACRRNNRLCANEVFRSSGEGERAADEYAFTSPPSLSRGELLRQGAQSAESRFARIVQFTKRIKNVLASGKLWKGGRDSNSETFR